MSDIKGRHLIVSRLFLPDISPKRVIEVFSCDMNGLLAAGG